MKLFLTYLKDYKNSIALWALFGVLNIFIGFLYQMPLERSILWLVICGFIGLIIGSFHFYTYFSTHKELQILQKQTYIEKNRFPKSKNVIETDYQELINQLNTTLSQLENNKAETEQEILDYFTMWIHQIKTPISALHLILQEEDKETSREINEQLFKIEQYIELILQYVRLGSSSTDYLFQKTDLDVLIRDTIKKHAPLFIRKNLPVHYDGIHQHIITDSKWLSFVLEQILSNALKYTHTGFISIYLEKNALVIKDTGIGIRPEDIPRVGERNFTGFTGRQHKKASGIGLHLSKEILKKLGHTLKISSEVNEGTKVSILFDQKQLITK